MLSCMFNILNLFSHIHTLWAMVMWFLVLQNQAAFSIFEFSIVIMIMLLSKYWAFLFLFPKESMNELNEYVHFVASLMIMTKINTVHIIISKDNEHWTGEERKTSSIIHLWKVTKLYICACVCVLQRKAIECKNQHFMNEMLIFLKIKRFVVFNKKIPKNLSTLAF